MEQDKPTPNGVILLSPEQLREMVYQELRRALADAGVGGQDDYLSQAEAAKLLRVTAPTLRRWRAEGKLKDVLKIGRTVRYSRAELLRLKNSGDES